MPAKIDVWFCSRNVQKAIAKMRPRYLERSAVSMRNAMNLMTWLRGLAPHPRSAHLLPARGEKDSMALAPQRGERVAEGRVRGLSRCRVRIACGYLDRAQILERWSAEGGEILLP